MVDVTGLKRPYTRTFDGKKYEVDSRAQTKKTATKIAKSLRKNGKKVRILTVKKGLKYAIYVQK